MTVGDGKQTAIIIGAGPAGLTAALEFCRRSEIKPIVLEASDRIGGLSCTIQHNGNRLDIGGHRFFSKSDRVMDWWTEVMPIADSGQDREFALQYQNQERRLRTVKKTSEVHGPMPVRDQDCVMLVRPRKSRIYFMRSFFHYPLSLSFDTLRRLGALRTARILFSYLIAQLVPLRPEKSLEQFLINRFGRELYLTFFKSYTEKVWGVPCDQISAAWGAQRIKGLSLLSVVGHFFKRIFSFRNRNVDIFQKDSQTSLIEHFLYPKFGPGQLWEHVARQVQSEGGEVRLGWRVEGLHIEKSGNGRMRVASVESRTPEGEIVSLDGDHFFSTMPVPELIHSMDTPVPQDICEIADGLMYRDLITVGLLVDRLLLTEPDGSMIKDTWIYLQEPDVLVGRIQIFNNWSPYMVSDPSKVWIGLEYFCYDTDMLWNRPDEEIVRFAIDEIARIGILRPDEVRDSCVFRAPKAYPAYFGTYSRFDEIIHYMERYENLFLVGRNGMHKYNNQDHSMLTAMLAVENILTRRKSKDNLWKVNTEQEYHEEKSTPAVPPVTRQPEGPHKESVA